MFGPTGRRNPDAILAGWATAARELGDLRSTESSAGYAPARAHVAAGALVCGSVTSISSPPDRDPLSREIAIEQHLFAEQMGPHRRPQRLLARAIGGKRRDSIGRRR